MQVRLPVGTHEAANALVGMELQTQTFYKPQSVAISFAVSGPKEIRGFSVGHPGVKATALWTMDVQHAIIPWVKGLGFIV